MPIAGNKVAKELKTVCSASSCENLNNWLNQLYEFKMKYNIYREELAK